MNFLILTFFFLMGHLVWAKEKICPQIIVHGDNSIKFDETEKRMLCGDKQVEAYKDIPTYQASFFITGFLQARSYLRPSFDFTGDVLNVHVGRKSYLKKVGVDADNIADGTLVKKGIRRKFKGRPLTPSLLNEIEAEALALLREHGHPCAKVESRVDSSDSSVRLILKHLKLFQFGEFERQKIKNLNDRALERYYPFIAEDIFNEKLLKLTEKRMLRAEVVQGTYFLDECSEDGTSYRLKQNFLDGPTKSIRFGAGASTEVGPMARVKWANNRYATMASQMSATLQASLRSQSLKLALDSFLWKHKPRRSLFAQAELLRESQFVYEQVVFRLKPHIKWTQDKRSRFWSWTFGPSYEAGTYHAKVAADTKSFSTGALEGNLQWMTHAYEFYDFHPQEGELFGINFDFRHPSLGFSNPMLKLDSTWAKLAQLGYWGRGAIVGGVRLGAATTWVANDVSAKGLPPTVKFYGGGSDDVRGFLLKTLPHNSGVGALTKLGAKFELRRTYLWKESLEAFSFVDSAYFGSQSWSIQPRLWYSPGVGIRWLSPIGLVQAYTARALSLVPNHDFGNFYFLGLGGVF